MHTPPSYATLSTINRPKGRNERPDVDYLTLSRITKLLVRRHACWTFCDTLLCDVVLRWDINDGVIAWTIIPLYTVAQAADL